MELQTRIERWDYHEPFVIAGHTFPWSLVVVVELQDGPLRGRGEAAGVYYLDDRAESMRAQVEGLRATIEAGTTRENVQELLPRGGARNALDCALWDLHCKREGKRIFEIVGLDPQPVTIFQTISIGTPEEMAGKAKGLDTPKLKLKLDTVQVGARIAAVRAARPDAEIIVDANQSWTIEQLESWAGICAQHGVSMIEQPLPRGADEVLASYSSPIPLCADESCLDSSEIADAAGRYQLINIKLDKCGGLTEALRMVDTAKRSGLGIMVGNMVGTSLAMAPAFLIAQDARFIDLDGPFFLTRDRDHGMEYKNGTIAGFDSELWG